MSDTEIKSCEEAIRLLAAYLDLELQASDRDRVARHLATCRSCYSRAEFEGGLKAQLAGLGHEPVDRELSERVQALVRTFTISGDA